MFDDDEPSFTYSATRELEARGHKRINNPRSSMDERAMGPVETWVRRWGHPNESGDRIWFQGEFDDYGADPSLDPDRIVPIFDFARETDTRIAKLEAENERLRSVLAEGLPRYCEMFDQCGLGDPATDSVWVQDARAALERAREGG